MARNIEIKARIESVEAMSTKALAFPMLDFSKRSQIFPANSPGHWFSVMGIAKCRRLASKPS
jgi:hypothetical protein